MTLTMLACEQGMVPLAIPNVEPLVSLIKVVVLELVSANVRRSLRLINPPLAPTSASARVVFNTSSRGASSSTARVVLVLIVAFSSGALIELERKNITDASSGGACLRWMVPLPSATLAQPPGGKWHTSPFIPLNP
eukprot:scaffold308727_cov36-Tisochrysis_lutea.AAC.5